MSKAPVMDYVQKHLKKTKYRSVAHLCSTLDLNYDNLGHYLRSEYKFNLHYFITLVEVLEVDVFEFYGVIYRAEKDKGLL